MRNRVQTLCQAQLQQCPPFAFGQAGKFIHFGVSEWIGGPEEFHVLMRPRAAKDVGGVEAGISRRDELLGFRHELWTPFGGRRTYLGHSIHRGVAWARITCVMSLADASGRTFLPADIRRI